MIKLLYNIIFKENQILFNNNNNNNKKKKYIYI